MTRVVSRFLRDDRGATAIEYALIAALVALAIMVGAGALGNNLNARYGAIANQVK